MSTTISTKLFILASVLADRLGSVEFVLIVGAPGSGGTSRVRALDLACFEPENGGRIASVICIDVSAHADEHRKSATPLGMIFEAMHAVRKNGGMYEDWPVLFAIADKIRQERVGSGKVKVVIRGLPRSEGQAHEVIELIKRGFKVTLMEFDVNEAQRLTNLARRAGEMRADDAPDVYGQRVREYVRTLPFVHSIRDHLQASNLGSQYHRHTTPTEGASIERDMRLIIEQLDLDGDIPNQLTRRLFDETSEAGRYFLPKHRQDLEARGPKPTS